jgi:hypothetical protein
MNVTVRPGSAKELIEHMFQTRRSQISGARFSKGAQSRVARWYIFKPKIPIWVNFGGP